MLELTESALGRVSETAFFKWKPGALKSNTFEFAIKTTLICKYLCEHFNEYNLSKQFVKSSTSVGANCSEASRAQTKADFIAKLSISHKEIGESIFWINLLFATDYINKEVYENLIEDAQKIDRIISKSLITAKSRDN